MTAPDDRTADLGFARVDLDRARRTGDAEVVYGEGKSPEQVLAIMARLREAHPDRAVLATRLSDEAATALAALPGIVLHPAARAATLGALPEPAGLVLVVSAGTSDGPVAAEAALTARVHGAGVEEVVDVGVAGLHRLLAVRDRLETADCLVVVAGMEGALPSVVGGLTGVPLVAVPTSVGYGASFGGLAALLGMLNSCSPGVTVVNIDNGYGAGVFAARVARRARPRGTSGRAASATDHTARQADTRGTSGRAASATDNTARQADTRGTSGRAASATDNTPRQADTRGTSGRAASATDHTPRRAEAPGAPDGAAQ